MQITYLRHSLQKQVEKKVKLWKISSWLKEFCKDERKHKWTQKPFYTIASYKYKVMRFI